MVIRPPKSLTNLPSGGLNRPTGAEVLEAEMKGEQAFMLGLAATKMERAIEACRNGIGDPRSTQIAANAVQSFFIQRELVGLDNHDYAIDFYDIPKHVLARVGAIDRSD